FLGQQLGHDLLIFGMGSGCGLLAGSFKPVSLGFGLPVCLALGGALGRNLRCALRDQVAGGDAAIVVWYTGVGDPRASFSVSVKKAAGVRALRGLRLI